MSGFFFNAVCHIVFNRQKHPTDDVTHHVLPCCHCEASRPLITRAFTLYTVPLAICELFPGLFFKHINPKVQMNLIASLKNDNRAYKKTVR